MLATLYETILVPPEAEWTMDMPAERTGTGDGKKRYVCMPKNAGEMLAVVWLGAL